MSGAAATITLLADRRSAGLLDLARAFTAELRRLDPVRRVSLIVDPALAREPATLPRDASEVALPASLPAMLTRLRAGGDVVLALRVPVRPEIVAALDRSTAVVVLTDAAVASLRATQRTLRLLTEVGYPVRAIEVALLGDHLPDEEALGSAATLLQREVVHPVARVRAACDDPGLAALARHVRRGAPNAMRESSA